jgi:iron complex transport system substrate-binding protein
MLITCDYNRKPILNNRTQTSVKYAKGFDIQPFKNFKKLIIKSPFQNADKDFEYILIPKDILIPEEFKMFNVIRTPIYKIVVTSTTHIPMLELLHEEKALVGFPNTQYISSNKTRALIKNGLIKELGKNQNINIEVLLELQPELIVGYSMRKNNKLFDNIQASGIPVLLNGDWLEESPLGRAEWLKFFAVLFEKEKLGDSIFSTIENEYQKAINLVKHVKDKPTVLSGVINKDVWNLPAGDSFVAQFLKDANMNYLWKNSKGNGSLSLSFEEVFIKGRHAEYWIAPGHYTSLDQMKNANSHYTEFESFKNKKVFSYSNKLGLNGGVLYYEMAPIQPHIVLKDIIKITHPQLLVNYKPYYFQQLK